MSSTHSDGQPLAATSSSSLSSPSSSPSQGANHESTVSVLLSFIVVFLSVFGIFMVTGIVLHYVVARRRQIIRAVLENIEQSELQQQKPKMWEVWAELPASLKIQRKWKDLNPFAAQANIPSSDNPQPVATEAILPFTARLAMQLTHDVILNRPLIPPSDNTGVKMPTTMDTIVPTPGTGIQVAVIIAMPSPHELCKEKGDVGTEELREYMIGTTRTYIDTP